MGENGQARKKWGAGYKEWTGWNFNGVDMDKRIKMDAHGKADGRAQTDRRAKVGRQLRMDKQMETDWRV